MNNTDKSVLSRKIHSPKNPPTEPSFVDTPQDRADTVAPLNLASRLIKLQSLILIAGALIAVYLVFTLHQLIGAHSLLEAAQMQRILNQRYAKEILLASSGVPVNYEKTARQWTKTHEVLSHGGRIPDEAQADGAGERVHAPAGVSKYAAALESLGNMRKNIIRESDAFIESNRLSQHRDQLFDELYRQSLALQAAGDALVATYDRHLNSGVSWWDVNAVAVELAERQRMLIQQHVKEVLFVAHGVPADYQATRLRLFETTRILAEGGELQIDGGSSFSVPAPSSSDVIFNLEEQKNALDRFTAVSNQFLMLSNEDVERTIQLKKLSDLSGEFHTAATALLRDYRGFFSGQVNKATRDVVLAGLLAAVFALLLAWSFARKYVDVPAAGLTAALRDLRAGRKPARQREAVGSGPLSAAAAEFDQLADGWETRREWFDGFLSADRPDALRDPGSKDPVAARLYEWLKTRASSPDALSPRRWDDAAASADENITVIGRLPDADTAPLISDSELLDQLIQRANELQHQNERLLRSHAELEASAQTLRGDKTADAEAIERLSRENSALKDQVAEQADKLGQLREQIEVLRNSESALKSGSDALRELSKDFEDRLSLRAAESAALERTLRETRDLLSLKQAEAERAMEERRADRDELSSRLSALERSLSDKEKSLREACAERDALILAVEEVQKRCDARSADIDRLNEASVAERAALESVLGELRSKLSDAERLCGIRDQEISDLRRRADEISGNAAAAAREYEQARERYTSEKASLESDLERLRVTIADLQSVSDGLRDALASREAALTEEIGRGHQLLERVGELERSRHDLGASQAALEEERRSLQGDLESLTRTKDRLQSEKDSLDALLADLRRQMEHRAAAHAEEVANYERVSSELREALRLESESVQALRIELAGTRDRHGLESAAMNDRLRQTELKLQDIETQLWQSQRLLSERQQELAAAKTDISSLTETRAAQSAQILALESGIAGVERELGAAASQLLTAQEERQRLERELAALKEAYFEKCQALASTEDRLNTTRAALKTTLEDLQERSKP